MGNPLAGKGSIAEKIFLSMKMRDITTERRFDGPMLSLSVTMAYWQGRRNVAPFLIMLIFILKCLTKPNVINIFFVDF